MGGPDGPSMATSDTFVADECECSIADGGCRIAAVPGPSIRLEEELGADARPAC